MATYGHSLRTERMDCFTLTSSFLPGNFGCYMRSGMIFGFSVAGVRRTGIHSHYGFVIDCITTSLTSIFQYHFAALWGRPQAPIRLHALSILSKFEPKIIIIVLYSSDVPIIQRAPKNSFPDQDSWGRRPPDIGLEVRGVVSGRRRHVDGAVQHCGGASVSWHARV